MPDELPPDDVCPERVHTNVETLFDGRYAQKLLSEISKFDVVFARLSEADVR